MLFILFSHVYTGLMRSVPGKNLMQIDDIVFGPFLGKAVSAAYISFFVIHLVANTRFACDFIVGLFMNETPLMVFASVFILLCAWAVREGLEVMARCSFVIMVAVSVFISLLFIFNTNHMDFNNFRPVLRVPVMDIAQSFHMVFSIFFCETFLFMMIMPYMSDQKKLRKSFVGGLAIGEATLLIVTMTTTLTMGVAITNVGNPLIAIPREVDMAQTVSRIEFLVLAAVMFSMFVKVAVSYYAAALGVAQLLNLRDYRPLIIPTGAVLIALIQPFIGSPLIQLELGRKTWPFYASVFEIVLPAVTLITAKLRGISADMPGQA